MSRYLASVTAHVLAQAHLLNPLRCDETSWLRQLPEGRASFGSQFPRDKRP